MIKYNCVIQFPDKNDKSERVVIRGDADNVKAAEAELSKLAAIKLEEGYGAVTNLPSNSLTFLLYFSLSPSPDRKYRMPS